jgi:hypothetical protein
MLYRILNVVRGSCMYRVLSWYGVMTVSNIKCDTGSRMYRISSWYEVQYVSNFKCDTKSYMY